MTSRPLPHRSVPGRARKHPPSLPTYIPIPRNLKNPTARYSHASPPKRNTANMGFCSAFLLVLMTIIFPPLGVFCVAGCGADLLINICLTILGYVRLPPLPPSPPLSLRSLKRGEIFARSSCPDTSTLSTWNTSTTSASTTVRPACCRCDARRASTQSACRDLAPATVRCRSQLCSRGRGRLMFLLLLLLLLLGLSYTYRSRRNGNCLSDRGGAGRGLSLLCFAMYRDDQSRETASP